MPKYIIKRILQMIPTLAGVILLTFILFNVVGGSPATMALGKHATARALEDYEAARGYNRPLIAGRWARTRAFEDTDFSAHAGLWGEKGVESYDDYLLLSAGTYEIPLAFSPDEKTTVRWQARYKMAGPQAVASIICRDSSGVQERIELCDKTRWKTDEAVFEAVPEGCAFSLVVEQGAMYLRRLDLRTRLENPLQSQLFLYLKQLSRFDFGMSLEANQRVSVLLKDGLIPSLCLTVPILFGGTVVALIMALLCAYFRDRFFDRILVVLSTVLMSVNYIIWVIAGQYFFAYQLKWFPIWGFESWRYLLLPVLIGIATSLGRDVRFYRTVMLDEMYKDYVRTARAKGVGPAGILTRHVLRNALVPVLTNVSISIPFLFTGSLLLESFFGIPGLGNLSINAINSSDLDVVRAVVLIGAVIYVMVNLLTDLCYAWVDPRVRLK